jgi:phosphoribosylanthranilate isomerase
MRVKICGIMREKDVKAAVDSGADALGFVVASPASPRNLPLATAQTLMKTVPVFSTKVAVTTAQDIKTVFNVCSRLKPDALQLHTHTPTQVRAFRRKLQGTQLILTTPVRDASSLRAAKAASSYSDAVLADSPSSSGMGGTGKTHDWHLTALIRNAIYPHPLILAGGLTSDNVRRAISEVRPFAVDVSSGVEERVGVKDHEKIREFVMNAKEGLA